MMEGDGTRYNVVQYSWGSSLEYSDKRTDCRSIFASLLLQASVTQCITIHKQIYHLTVGKCIQPSNFNCQNFLLFYIKINCRTRKNPLKKSEAVGRLTFQCVPRNRYWWSWTENTHFFSQNFSRYVKRTSLCMMSLGR